MLYLRTLGPVYVSRDGGPPLGGAATQRRFLALMSVLSAAGDAGMSRDRVISLLWPDSDPEKGRNSLSQAVYQAKRAVTCEELFAPGTDLRLNPEYITSDVRELQLALAAGDFGAAAQWYAGPFLDDFYVAGNVDFERWAEAQRSRLAGEARRMFDRLALQAGDVGDLTASIEWRRRALALDPVDSVAARALVIALRDAGDHSDALRQIELHEAVLRAELDIEPGPEFTGLRESLRRGATISEGSASTAIAVPPPVSTSPDSESESLRARGWRWSPPSPWTNLVAASVVVATALWIGSRSTRDATTEPALRFDQQVVVAPFSVAGADPSLAFLREGLVELLSMRLGGDSAAQAVDPGTVLRAWRNKRLADSVEMPRTEIVQFANRFGARSVVAGTVVGDARHLVISASLLDVSSDALQLNAVVNGPLDSLTVLVDRLAARLLIASAGEADRFAGSVTPSLPALQAYLSGLTAYRHGRYASAIGELERALRADTTFALAAMHLALAADRVNAAEQHDRALSTAWEYRHELSERDRLHLIAFAGPRYPEPSTESEQLAAWEAAVARSPDRIEVLVELAERFIQSGRLLGVDEPEKRAATLLRRALDIDARESNALGLIVLLDARSNNLASAQPREGGASASDPLPMFVRWRAAIARGDTQELVRIRTGLTGVDDRSLTAIGRLSQFDGAGIEDGERALRIKRLRARRAADQLDAILSQHSLAMNQGRPVLALDFTEQLQETQPGTRAHLRLRVLDALYGGGDSSAAVDAAAALSRFVNQPPQSLLAARAVQLADACVLAQWRLARGERSGIARTIVELRAAGTPRNPVPVGANPHTCAELLDASLAVSVRSRDATARVTRLDALMLGGPAASDAGAYAHIMVARLHEKLGNPKLALAAIRRRPYMHGWPRYLATARREEGRLALAAGDKAGSLVAYREYLALRGAPEGPAAAEVAEIRALAEAAARP